jgi:2-polyprenyl-3-methyl-5-hydroxy-6-metoxy-1,4-benzoquinol methylase
MSHTIPANPAFWDRIAKTYSKQKISDPEAYEKKLALTQSYLTPESRVMEFGCGTGSTALIHAPHVGHILATDISQGMIDIAEKKLAETNHHNVTFKRATLESLATEEPFDVILGLNILHLLGDVDGAIERCRDLLKPGGVFISSTACITEVNFLIRALLPLGGMLGLIPKVQIFSAADLERRIISKGFEILSHDSFNKDGVSAFIVARKPA